MSMRCLERANFDRTEARTLCWDYFKAYRECKKEWVSCCFHLVSPVCCPNYVSWFSLRKERRTAQKESLGKI